MDGRAGPRCAGTLARVGTQWANSEPVLRASELHRAGALDSRFELLGTIADGALSAPELHVADELE